LFRGTRDEPSGGLVRDEQNWIGGSSSGPADADFVPPPAEFVWPALEDLAAFINRTDLPPVLQAAVVHAQFETIHPFLDGNGRVGRALIHVVLKRRGLTPFYVPPISLVLAGRAGRYVQGLTDYRFGNENAWYLTFAEAVESAADGARDFIASVRALQEDWRTRAGNPRPQSAAAKLIDALPAHPVVNLKTVQEVLDMSPEAARQALNRLEQAGVLRQVSVGRRNRAFESEGLFALLDAFEGELGPAGRVPAPSQH
jgi:Fic family protein